MKTAISLMVLFAVLMVCCSGCLVVQHKEEIIRENETLKSIRFESDDARKEFERRAQCNSSSRRNRGDESLVIPFIIASHVEKELSYNGCYNDAIDACDINNDGTITLEEAQAFNW